MEYLVVIEQGTKSFGAYVPDLPGCVAVGSTRREVLKFIREAIELHIEGMQEDGTPIPAPSSVSAVVQVKAAEPSTAYVSRPPKGRKQGAPKRRS